MTIKTLIHKLRCFQLAHSSHAALMVANCSKSSADNNLSTAPCPLCACQNKIGTGATVCRQEPSTRNSQQTHVLQCTHACLPVDYLPAMLREHQNTVFLGVFLVCFHQMAVGACVFCCRVTLRLHREAQHKDERMRERREHQEDETDAAARHARAQAMQDGTAQRSSGGGSRSAGGSSGGDGPSAEFYERQQALLERRKQREAQRRPSDEDELEECVCEWLQNDLHAGEV
jgi:hypothetical protein